MSLDVHSGVYRTPEPADQFSRENRLHDPYLDLHIHYNDKLKEQTALLKSLENCLHTEDKDSIFCEVVAGKRAVVLERIQDFESKLEEINWKLDVLIGKEVLV